MAKMKENNNNNAIMEDVYTYCTGIGVARIPVIKQLNEGNPIPVKLIPKPASGRIEVVTTSSNQKIGYVMASSENPFEMNKNREPATNTILDTHELLAKIGNTPIEGVAITASSVSVIKIRLDMSNISADVNNATVVEETVDTPVDLSAFSPNDAKEVKKRLDYIKKECNYSEKVRKNISAAYINFMQSHTGIREFNPIFINNDGIMESAIKNILVGNNLALVGPKGLGKNVLVEHLANFFDLGLCDIQMSYDTAKEEIRGEPTFLEDGKIGVRLSNLVAAAQGPNICNIDEANTARGSITSMMHSLTDHRRYIEVPGYGLVKIHSQARFILTMNEGDEYEGTRQLNAAFRDRFHEIIFKPNPNSMKDVFMTKCNLSETDAETLSKFYKLIHAAVYNSDSDACIPEEYLSQRKFVRAGNLYSLGFANSIEEAFREAVIETIADAEIKGIIENLILINCQ